MSDVVTPAPASAGSSAEKSARARRGLTPSSGSGRSTRLIGEVVVDLGMADRETVDRAVETVCSVGAYLAVAPLGTALVYGSVDGSILSLKGFVSVR